MVTTAVAFYKKITSVERQVQKLKTEAFFALPKVRDAETYPTKDIMRALKNTRVNIWRARYAKK